MSIQGWFHLRLTGLVSLLKTLRSLLQYQLSGVLSSTTIGRHQFSGALPLYGPALTPSMTTGKTIALTIRTFVRRMCLCFSTQSRFVIAFLPRSSHLLISWLQSHSAVILEPKKRNSVTISTFSPSICHEVMGLNAVIFFLFFNI